MLARLVSPIFSLCWLYLMYTGENSKTLMLVHVSPKEDDVGETICSLTFASRARGTHLGRDVSQVDDLTSSIPVRNLKIVCTAVCLSRCMNFNKIQVLYMSLLAALTVLHFENCRYTPYVQCSLGSYLIM